MSTAGKRFLLLGGSFLVALLLFEGAVRVRQYWKHGTTAATVFEWETSAETGLRVPSPNQVTGGIRTDGRSFRNPELENPKPEGRLRIAIVGASTSFCAEASSNETTWPHRVAAKAREKWPAREIDYVNAGVPGYTTIQSRLNLEKRVRPLAPDLIVIYHATNDLSSDTREMAEAQGVFEGKAEDPSWLAKISVAWALIEKNLTIAARQRAAQSSTGRLVFDAGTLPARFRERLAALVDEAKASAPLVALATFAPKVRREQSPEVRLAACNTSLFYMPYMSVDGLLDAFEAYNRVIREVAAEKGVLLIEDEFSIPGDDVHYNDSVHFKDAGCEKMADRVIAALAESEEWQRLVAGH